MEIPHIPPHAPPDLANISTHGQLSSGVFILKRMLVKFAITVCKNNSLLAVQIPLKGNIYLNQMTPTITLHIQPPTFSRLSSHFSNMTQPSLIYR
jgi:hypothetical protein